MKGAARWAGMAEKSCHSGCLVGFLLKVMGIHNAPSIQAICQKFTPHGQKTCYEFFYDFVLSNSGRCLSIDLLDVGQIPPGQNSFRYNPKDKISFLISIVQLNIYILPITYNMLLLLLIEEQDFFSCHFCGRILFIHLTY